MHPSWPHLRALLLCVAATGVAACGGGGGGSSSSAPSIAVADSLTNLQPTSDTVLSPVNAAGQDEDPVVLRTPDALWVAWFSDRNGTQNDGVIDREIFLMRTTDGRRFTNPEQITRADRFSFYPRMAIDARGIVHMAWDRVVPIPVGCIPGQVNQPCTGTLNQVLYKRSNDDRTWVIDAEMAIGSGPGDWLPTIVIDRRNDRPIVYFASPVRNQAGAVDLSLSTLRIYRVVFDGTNWSAPEMIQGVNADTSHNTYPTVVQRRDNTFMMAWTRYPLGNRNFDPGQVVNEPSAETWFGESTDGVNFTAMRQLSDSSAAAPTDVFPTMYVAHDGISWFALWQSGATGVGVETALSGGSAFQRVVRPEVAGYTPYVVATPTDGVFWSAWTVGPKETPKIHHRYFRK